MHLNFVQLEIKKIKLVIYLSTKLKMLKIKIICSTSSNFTIILKESEKNTCNLCFCMHNVQSVNSRNFNILINICPK